MWRVSTTILCWLSMGTTDKGILRGHTQKPVAVPGRAVRRETRAWEMATSAAMIGVMRAELDASLRGISRCPNARWNTQVAAATHQRRKASRLRQHINKARDPEATLLAWEAFFWTANPQRQLEFRSASETPANSSCRN